VSRRIVIHSLDHARAAVAAAAALGVPLMLVSAKGAGGQAGALWFKAVSDTAAREHPTAAVTAALDCGDEGGTALGTLRAGIKLVLFAGPDAVRARISQVAAQLDAAVVGDTGEEVLDLLQARDPAAACKAFLARKT
jgi:hypothetical protein